MYMRSFDDLSFNVKVQYSDLIHLSLIDFRVTHNIIC